MADSVGQNIRHTEERNWKSLALNKEEWKKLLKKFRGHTGLSGQ
jgi:hypothetical protein